ncbi:peroxiredoxin [Actinomycetospora sp. CA-101289]|uniref:peroxiredoxin n=1 Tax=Actinomycetospora sp. CA-101289 TaxID=3239893 RepID=UPI003D98CC22
MKAGDTAPDFELADDTGGPRSLAGLLADGPVVLFFYPLASSGGCTQESCHFRDLAGEFAAVGAQRVGISADSVDKQHTFSSANGFDYPLLSDPGGVVAKQFGAKRSWLPALPVKRKTFVIDTDRTVLGVIGSEMKFDQHADDALALLRARQGA